MIKVNEIWKAIPNCIIGIAIVLICKVLVRVAVRDYKIKKRGFVKFGTRYVNTPSSFTTIKNKAK